MNITPITQNQSILLVLEEVNGKNDGPTHFVCLSKEGELNTFKELSYKESGKMIFTDTVLANQMSWHLHSCSRYQRACHTDLPLQRRYMPIITAKGSVEPIVLRLSVNNYKMKELQAITKQHNSTIGGSSKVVILNANDVFSDLSKEETTTQPKLFIHSVRRYQSEARNFLYRLRKDRDIGYYRHRKIQDADYNRWMFMDIHQKQLQSAPKEIIRPCKKIIPATPTSFQMAIT